MSKTSRLLRLSTAALLVVFTSLVSACSDSTGPASAKRSGYITSSTAMQAKSSGSTTTPVAPTAPTGTSTGTSTGTTAAKDSTSTNNSGYNVTAF